MTIGRPHFSHAIPVSAGFTGLPCASASAMYLHFESGQARYFFPALLSLSRRLCFSHFGQRCCVGRAVTTGFPSAPRFIVVGQVGAFSHVKNVPNRPSFLTMNPPHAGHLMSVFSGPRISSPSDDRL